MPNLSLLQTQSLIPSTPSAGSGADGGREFLAAAGSLAGSLASAYEHHQDEQARVWAGSASADLHLKQLQATQDIRQQAVDAIANKQPVPDMVGQFDQGFKAYSDQVLSTAPNARARQYLQSQVQSSRAALGGQVLGQQAQLEREWKVSTANDTMMNGAKIVQQDPAQFDAQMGNIMGTMPHIDPTTDAAHALKAKATLANAAATSVLNSNPYALRDATSRAMGTDPSTGKPFSGPSGAAYVDAATPEEVHSWNSAATAKIRMLENGARLDADARERAAQTEFNTLQGFVAQGSVPDIDYARRVQETTRGTSFEASATAAVQLAQRGAGFGSATLPAQQARLEGMRTAQAGGTNPEDTALLKQLQTIHDTQTADYKQDPLDAAGRYAHVNVTPTQQITSAEQALQLVATRTGALPAVETAAGAPASPLHPAEAKQLGILIRSMQPDQAASALSTMGQAIGDPQRIAAFGKQLEDADGVLGLAMAYAGDKTSQGRQVSELLLRGDQALKDKRTEVQVQQSEAWKATAATQIRGAFSDVDVESKAIMAAQRINAATALDGQDDMDAAVRMATGGITTHGAAGAKVPLPYGMKADVFEKKLGALAPANFAAQVPDGVVHVGPATIPLQQFVSSLKDATLVHAGQGLYNVRGGNTLATNAKGQRITIHITP